MTYTFAEVRDYIYEILMYLVGVHAEVSAIAKSLLERTLTTLIIETVNEALECFKQIKKFGMGGMLRATLEIEFMHQTLVQYVNESANWTLKEVYTTISKAFTRRPGAEENLQRELDGVKQTLYDTRRITAIEFKCFRRPKDKTTSSRSSAADRESTATT
ncbi:hypothetical protein FS842_000992 [Serendipita sp. 407]|nr:hypothetical protein FS842_000992 [Serendipita sp. 407]